MNSSKFRHSMFNVPPVSHPFPPPRQGHRQNEDCRTRNAASGLAKLLDCACLFWPFSFDFLDHRSAPQMNRHSKFKVQTFNVQRSPDSCPCAPGSSAKPRVTNEDCSFLTGEAFGVRLSFLALFLRRPPPCRVGVRRRRAPRNRHSKFKVQAFKVQRSPTLVQ